MVLSFGGAGLVALGNLLLLRVALLAGSIGVLALLAAPPTPRLLPTTRRRAWRVADLGLLRAEFRRHRRSTPGTVRHRRCRGRRDSGRDRPGRSDSSTSRCSPPVSRSPWASIVTTRLNLTSQRWGAISRARRNAASAPSRSSRAVQRSPRSEMGTPRLDDVDQLQAGRTPSCSGRSSRRRTPTTPRVENQLIVTSFRLTASSSTTIGRASRRLRRRRRSSTSGLTSMPSSLVPPSARRSSMISKVVRANCHSTSPITPNAGSQ